MTDNEIIKALECCVNIRGGRCSECQFYKVNACQEGLCEKALDLINRQQAEIERLKKQLDMAENCIYEVEDAAYRGGSNDYIDKAIEAYNNLAKEMTEQRKEDEGK